MLESNRSVTRYDLETDPDSPPNPVLEIIYDYGLQNQDVYQIFIICFLLTKKSFVC